MIKYILIFVIFVANLYAVPNSSTNPFQDKVNRKNKSSQECNFNQQLGSSTCSNTNKSIVKRIPPSESTYKRSTKTP